MILTMHQNTKHIPVMVEEATDLLITDKGGIYVDATVGTGGHTKRLIEKLDKNGKVIAIDWDPEMLNLSMSNLSDYLDRVRFVGGNFANLDEILKKQGISFISGLLLDLGVSSIHFDKASRGFSFKNEGPLDMRINPANPLTAYTIVNTWPYQQLEHLIRICGERISHKITKAIIEEREKKEIRTTKELASIVERVIPKKETSKKKIHPATKTFLALRVAVNYEFDNLTKVLQKALTLIAPGGRIIIITFHSLEDRIVKETFKFMAKMGGWKLITKKPITPTSEEIQLNPRARSAKLRAIERQ